MACKGPDYCLLKTVIFPISVFLSLFSVKSVLAWKMISISVLDKADSYFSLFITVHVQNKQFL